MKKLIFFFVICISASLFSCGGDSSNTSENEAQNDTITQQQEADSVAALIKTLDSISNSGLMVHYDIYKIGDFKGIEITVNKVTVDTIQISHINLRKDCGGQYYYSWEDALIFAEELPAFYSSISTIKSNIVRDVDHEERFVYATKDDIAIVSICKSGSKWTTRLSVDYHKSNSFVNLTPSDIDTFVDLMKKAESKLNEIK